MKKSIKNKLIQDLKIRQAELNRDKQDIETLFNRFGGRESLLSVASVGVQKQQGAVRIAVQN